MSAHTPAQMLRLIAELFDRQGWQYDLTLGPELVAHIERAGSADGQALAQRIPADFFDRNRTTRQTVAAALDRALAGRSVERSEQPAVTLQFADNRQYVVKLARGAQLTNSNLNLGDGTQVNVNVEVGKDEVLAGLEVLLRAGLAGELDHDALRDLGSVIDSRDDIEVEDVRQLTAEVVRTEQPTQGKVKALLGKLAVSGVGGAVGTGISAAIGELISQLPL
jgi:hypothetical protein